MDPSLPEAMPRSVFLALVGGAALGAGLDGGARVMLFRAARRQRSFSLGMVEWDGPDGRRHYCPAGAAGLWPPQGYDDPRVWEFSVRFDRAARRWLGGSPWIVGIRED